MTECVFKGIHMNECVNESIHPLYMCICMYVGMCVCVCAELTYYHSMYMCMYVGICMYD